MEKRTGLLIAFSTLSSLGLGMVAPYIPLYGEKIGMTVSLVGYLIFACYGVEVILRIPLGFLTGILSYGSIVIVGAGAMVGASLFYLSSSWLCYLIFFAQSLLGVGISITWVTVPAFITLVKGSIAKYTFSVGLGFLFGPPFGGFIEDNFGMHYLFIIFFLLSILMLALALLFYREELGGSMIPTSPNQHKPPGEREEILAPRTVPELASAATLTSFSDAFDLLKRRKRILMAGIVSFVMFMTFAMGFSLLPLYLSSVGLSSFLIGTFLFLRAGTGTLIRLGTEKILKLGNKMTILLVGSGLTGAAILLVSMTSYLPMLLLLSAIWGLSGGIYIPIVFALIADATTAEERGTAMGLRGTIGTAGSAIGVLIFMNLAEILTIQKSLSVFGAFILIFSGILLFFWKALEFKK